MEKQRYHELLFSVSPCLCGITFLKGLIVAGAFLCAIAMLWPDAESVAAQSKQFSPTAAPPNAQYVGEKTCALCHEDHVEGQKKNAMHRALETVAEAEVLRTNPKLSFTHGPYNYTIERKGNESIYTVTNGRDTISVPIAWAFGMNKMGQTYVLQYKGQYYESRVSFYKDTQNLDLTLGAPATTIPKTIEEAMGRAMQSADLKDCFGCHAQAAVSGTALQLEKLTPGVTCESCHGPGADHVALARTGKAPEAKEKRIYNPAVLSAYDLSQQYCGACHRSWEQVQLMGLRGVGNVRFQPYRITYSECYDPEDRRIACTACHNPHKSMEHDALSYDAKCMACHQSPGKAASAKAPKAKAPACRVGKENCASCHMPEYEIPGSHFRFRDHMIRVVKPNEPYPN